MKKFRTFLLWCAFLPLAAYAQIPHVPYIYSIPDYIPDYNYNLGNVGAGHQYGQEWECVVGVCLSGPDQINYANSIIGPSLWADESWANGWIDVVNGVYYQVVGGIPGDVNSAEGAAFWAEGCILDITLDGGNCNGLVPNPYGPVGTVISTVGPIVSSNCVNLYYPNQGQLTGYCALAYNTAMQAAGPVLADPVGYAEGEACGLNSEIEVLVCQDVIGGILNPWISTVEGILPNPVPNPETGALTGPCRSHDGLPAGQIGQNCFVYDSQYDTAVSAGGYATKASDDVRGMFTSITSYLLPIDVSHYVNGAGALGTKLINDTEASVVDTQMEEMYAYDQEYHAYCEFLFVYNGSTCPPSPLGSQTSGTREGAGTNESGNGESSLLTLH